MLLPAPGHLNPCILYVMAIVNMLLKRRVVLILGLRCMVLIAGYGGNVVGRCLLGRIGGWGVWW